MNDDRLIIGGHEFTSRFILTHWGGAIMASFVEK